jgi:hypothetical protein
MEDYTIVFDKLAESSAALPYGGAEVVRYLCVPDQTAHAVHFTVESALFNNSPDRSQTEIPPGTITGLSRMLLKTQGAVACGRPGEGKRAENSFGNAVFMI